MATDRLEAFSDGVFAIIITITVLELNVPRGVDRGALRLLVPVFLTYVLSFTYLGVYWNNHHPMLHVTRRVAGGILWASLHLLFWLSLVPLVPGWMGENHVQPLRTALYGAVLLLATIAYFVLARVIIASEGRDSLLSSAFGRDVKGRLSIVIYAVGHEPADLAEGETELPGEEDLLQPLEILRSVEPVAGRRVPRGPQQSDLVVVMQRPDAHVRQLRHLTDRIRQRPHLPEATVDPYVT
jgi:uncharacterized membrane protein